MGRKLVLRGLLVVAVLVVASCSSDDDSKDARPTDQPAAEQPGADVAEPTVTGPVSGGHYGVPFNPVPAAVAEKYDYTEEEYFLEGTATAYQSDGTWGLDGVWPAKAADGADYKTRMVVRRPTDPDKFNGTVLVEWLNVTAGMDSDPDFGFTHDEIMGEGWAYVGVSAQKVGIEGGSGLRIDIPGFTVRALKEWDPERYGSLVHPGDAYSYDIFSQAAQALRRPGDIDPLDGLRPTTIIAAGESQSAMRMATYVNAVHPLAQIYDGFLIHSRGGSGAEIAETTPSPVPEVGHIRTDLDQPVLQFVTETDLFGLGFHDARQEDSDTVRTWEVAGTAHADQSTIDYGVESGRAWDTTTVLDFSGLCGRLNEGPQGAVLRRAVGALRDWVVDGTLPPAAPPIEIAGGTAIARDARGNALGGIRTPPTDAPVAVLTGEAVAGNSVFCSLFGQTTPFDAATLTSLYPSHDAYVDAVRAAGQDAVDAGFLLQPDADSYVSAAEAAAVPT
ncbi:MAG TPA: alpha/beta hydrolase domain-containing protein [Acidimicrobiales bacterium]|jgi:hypothetical protein